MPKIEVVFQSQADENNWLHDFVCYGYAIAKQTPHGLEHIPYNKFIKDHCNE